MIIWEKPSTGMVKLNVDATFDNPNNMVGIGGIFLMPIVPFYGDFVILFFMMLLLSMQSS